MKRFSVGMCDVAIQALQRVALQHHWSRERAARLLIWEALKARGEVGSQKPAQVIHEDLIRRDRDRLDIES